ncbi:MAG: methyltransferase domain-containing protein [Frankiaceae bacterium]
MDQDSYLLAQAPGRPDRPDRQGALSTLFDWWTFRHLDAVGIGPSWHCWEVGAGGPGIVRWLAGRVGPTGHVLATDLDVSRLVALAGAVVEVRRHDVVADPVPAAAFDLVHARLVLVHLAERERVLRSLAAAVRPGGWLVVEDADPELQPLACPDVQTPDAELANKVRSAFRRLLAGRGADLGFGRTLPRRLRAVGLTYVACDAYFPVALPACAELETATVTLLRDQLTGRGHLSAAEVNRHLANVAAGRVDLAQPPLISAWGRRPEARAALLAAPHGVE